MTSGTTLWFGCHHSCFSIPVVWLDTPFCYSNAISSHLCLPPPLCRQNDLYDLVNKSKKMDSFFIRWKSKENHKPEKSKKGKTTRYVITSSTYVSTTCMFPLYVTSLNLTHAQVFKFYWVIVSPGRLQPMISATGGVRGGKNYSAEIDDAQMSQSLRSWENGTQWYSSGFKSKGWRLKHSRQQAKYNNADSQDTI